MLLKRIYDAPEDGAKPRIKGVLLGHTGVAPEQTFAEGLVEQAEHDKWMTKSSDEIVIHTKNAGDLNYRIKRRPGYYCCHCGERIPDAGAMKEPGVTVGSDHVATEHKGAESPDSNNPSGYRKLNGYECVLDRSQHERHAVKAPGQAWTFNADKAASSSRKPARKGRG